METGRYVDGWIREEGLGEKKGQWRGVSQWGKPEQGNGGGVGRAAERAGGGAGRSSLSDGPGANVVNAPLLFTFLSLCSLAPSHTFHSLLSPSFFHSVSVSFSLHSIYLPTLFLFPFLSPLTPPYTLKYPLGPPCPFKVRDPGT